MKRRTLIAGLGGASALRLTWPLAARAQQPSRMRRVGVLFGGGESDPQQIARVAAFRQGLKDLKWIEGENLVLDIRYGRGDVARINALAVDLVASAPDAIHGTVTPALRALKRATRTIPIVFAGVADPVGDGLAASLARPGGNITGFSSADASLAGKWLQLLKEMSPGLARVMIVFNPDTAPHSIFWPALASAAPSLGMTLIRAEVRDRAAIESAMAALAGDPAVGLVVMPDSFVNLHRAMVIELAARHRAPGIYFIRTFADDGGLMAYGPDYVDIGRRAASYVDLILKGANPADLPVQAPTKFEFVLNLKTAAALGLSPPSALIARADEVIE